MQKKTEIIMKQETENNYLIEKIKSLEKMAHQLIATKSPDKNTMKIIKNFMNNNF